MSEQKMEKLLNQLSHVKFQAIHNEGSKKQMSEGLSYLNIHHSELMGDLDVKLKQLQQNCQILQKQCHDKNQHFKRNCKKAKGEIDKYRKQVQDLTKNAKEYFIEITKEEAKNAKNRKDVILEKYNQTQKFLSGLLNSIYCLEEQIMGNKMKIATTAKAVIKDKNKKLDEILIQQQKDLLLIEETKEKLHKQCDTFQKEVKNQLNEQLRETEQKRCKIYSTLQRLLAQVDSN